MSKTRQKAIDLCSKIDNESFIESNINTFYNKINEENNLKKLKSINGIVKMKFLDIVKRSYAKGKIHPWFNFTKDFYRYKSSIPDKTKFNFINMLFEIHFNDKIVNKIKEQINKNLKKYIKKLFVKTKKIKKDMVNTLFEDNQELKDDLLNYDIQNRKIKNEKLFEKKYYKLIEDFKEIFQKLKNEKLSIRSLILTNILDNLKVYFKIIVEKMF